MTERVVELFAGPGGMSEGLRLAGIDPDSMVGIEWDKAACDTARTAGHHRIQGDVLEIEPGDVATSLGGRITGLHSSAPCQGMSTAGKGDGRKDIDTAIQAIRTARNIPAREIRDFLLSFVKPLLNDDKSLLTLVPLYWIGDLAPEWVTFEQVPTVLPIWEGYAETLRWWGYDVWTGKVHAEQYGVPQTRTRAILRASRTKRVHPPTPTHSRFYTRDPERLDEGVKPWVSMAEALGWDGAIMRSNYGTGGDPQKRGERTMEQPAPTVTGKIGRNKWMVRAAVPGDTSWAYRRPSPTIVGSSAPDVVAAPGYHKAGDGPRQSQPGSIRVTVEEAGVLQSFPRDFPWQGAKTKKFQQVGNAVPPLLGEAMVRDLL